LEVSGLEGGTFAGFGDAGAAQGQAGSLLLDPKNITISDGGATVNSFALAQTLLNPTLAADEFSRRVVGISGDNLLIGALLDDTAATDAGAAYLFDTSGTLQQTFLSPTPAASDWFGGAVAIDDTDILIAADRDDTGATDAGAVYLFDASDGLQQTLLNPTPDAGDNFGDAVAIDGSSILVGTYRDDTGATDAGVVYLFDTSGTLQQTLLNPTPDAGDEFGRSVALYDTNILVGARFDDTGATDAGVAYLFNTSGTLQQTLLNPTPAAGDQFGDEVAIDGTNILIGAYLDDTGATDAGAAYLFDTSGTLQQTLLNPTPAASDLFGESVAINGTNILIGASQDDTGATDAGAAYLFNTSGTLEQTLLNPTPTASDLFGESVAIDGSNILIGAYQDDTGATNAGAAYLFSEGSNLFSSDPSGSFTFDADRITRVTNTSTSITLQANNDITLNEAIITSVGGDGGAITLQAGRSILVNANITTDDGALTLSANDAAALTANRDAGDAIISIASGVTLNTGIDNLALTANGGSIQNLGSLTTTEGSINLTANDILGSGSLTTTGGGINLAANNITIGAITTTSTTGGAVSLTSNAGTLTTGDINTAGTTGAGGAVTLNASSNLTSTNITTTGTSGGNVTLASSGGTTTASEINTAGSTGAGGTVNLNASGNLTSANITTTGTSGGNVTLASSGGTTTASEINTAGSTGAGGTVTLNASGNLTSTNIATTGTNSGAVTFTSSAGSLNVGNLNTSSTTGTGGMINLTANEIITSLITTTGTSGGAVALTSNTGIATTSDITTSGSNGIGGTVTLNASGNLTSTNITTTGTSGGNVALASSGGTTTASEINTAGSGGAGGTVNLSSSDNLTSANITTTGTSGGNVTLASSGGTTTASEINTSGSTGAGGTVNLSASGNLTSTNITTTGMNSGAATFTSSAGSLNVGNLNTSSTTGTGGMINLTANEIITSLITTTGTSGGAVALTSNTGIATTSDINTTGTAGAGGAVSLNASGNLTSTNITTTGTSGGNVTLASSGGTTTASEINAAGSSGAGGTVNLSSSGNLTSTNITTTGTSGGNVALFSPTGTLTTGAIDATSTNGPGGNVNLTTTIASSTANTITTGNISTVGTSGGSVALLSPVGNIVAANIDASGTAGNGGNVTIDPTGDVQVNTINAQGGSSGTGGTVDITLGNFFRATGEFVDRNGTVTSISTAGGSGGGAITIRYARGLNGNIPFIIGDATLNGAAALITNGNTILANQDIFGNLIEGAVSVLIEGGIELSESLGICPPACSVLKLESVPLLQDPFVQASLLGNTTHTPNAESDVAIAMIEQVDARFTTEFSDFLGLADTSGTSTTNSKTVEGSSSSSNASGSSNNASDSSSNVSGSSNTSSSSSNVSGSSNGASRSSSDASRSSGNTSRSPNNSSDSSDGSGSDSSDSSSSDSGDNFSDSDSSSSSSDGDSSSGDSGDNSSDSGNSSSDGGDDSDESESSTSETATQIRNQLGNVQAQSDLKPALIYITFGQNGTGGLLPATDLDSDRLELVLATGQGNPIHVPMSDVTRKDVQLMVQRLRRQVSTPSLAGTDSYLFSSQQLYQWLIVPLEAQLQAQGIDTIGFVVEAGLRSLPFAALHDGERFLVEQYNFSMIPSLSLTNLDYVSLQNQGALVGGSTEFVTQPPLPTAAVEVSTIQNLWPGQQLQDDDFKLDTLRNERQQSSYGIIHLATHGQFSRGELSNSYVQFADQKLRLDQIRELNWHDPPVELVTLSACQTALGNREAEMGFAGLALLAGAKSALASLWSVSDSATTGLMVQFYQNLRDGGDKAESLQQAQRALLHNEVWMEGEKLHWSGGSMPLPPDATVQGQLDFSHPFYWSAFTMVGSPW
jgi:CHAT domain-containing protein